MKESSKNATQALALIAVALVATLIFASPLISVKADTASEPSETQQFVHTYTNSSRGNWTSVGKPMFPIYINDSQIGVGANEHRRTLSGGTQLPCLLLRRMG